MHLAAKYPNWEVLYRIIELGGDANYGSHHPNFSAFEGLWRNIEILVKGGAKPLVYGQMYDECGDEPLTLAVKGSHPEACAILVHLGAPLDMVINRSQSTKITLLDLAIGRVAVKRQEARNLPGSVASQLEEADIILKAMRAANALPGEQGKPSSTRFVRAILEGLPSDRSSELVLHLPEYYTETKAYGAATDGSSSLSSSSSAASSTASRAKPEARVAALLSTISPSSLTTVSSCARSSVPVMASAGPTPSTDAIPGGILVRPMPHADGAAMSSNSSKPQTVTNMDRDRLPAKSAHTDSRGMFSIGSKRKRSLAFASSERKQLLPHDDSSEYATKVPSSWAAGPGAFSRERKGSSRLAITAPPAGKSGKAEAQGLASYSSYTMASAGSPVMNGHSASFSDVDGLASDVEDDNTAHQFVDRSHGSAGQLYSGAGRSNFAPAWLSTLYANWTQSAQRMLQRQRDLEEAAGYEAAPAATGLLRKLRHVGDTEVALVKQLCRHQASALDRVVYRYLIEQNPTLESKSRKQSNCSPSVKSVVAEGWKRCSDAANKRLLDRGTECMRAAHLEIARLVQLCRYNGGIPDDIIAFLRDPDPRSQLLAEIQSRAQVTYGARDEHNSAGNDDTKSVPMAMQYDMRVKLLDARQGMQLKSSSVTRHIGMQGGSLRRDPYLQTVLAAQRGPAALMAGTPTPSTIRVTPMAPSKEPPRVSRVALGAISTNDGSAQSSDITSGSSSGEPYRGVTASHPAPASFQVSTGTRSRPAAPVKEDSDGVSVVPSEEGDTEEDSDEDSNEDSDEDSDEDSSGGSDGTLAKDSAAVLQTIKARWRIIANHILPKWVSEQSAILQDASAPVEKFIRRLIRKGRPAGPLLAYLMRPSAHALEDAIFVRLHEKMPYLNSEPPFDMSGDGHQVMGKKEKLCADWIRQHCCRADASSRAWLEQTLTAVRTLMCQLQLCGQMPSAALDFICEPFPDSGLLKNARTIAYEWIHRGTTGFLGANQDQRAGSSLNVEESRSEVPALSSSLTPASAPALNVPTRHMRSETQSIMPRRLPLRRRATGAPSSTAHGARTKVAVACQSAQSAAQTLECAGFQANTDDTRARRQRSATSCADTARHQGSATSSGDSARRHGSAMSSGDSARRQGSATSSGDSARRQGSAMSSGEVVEPHSTVIISRIPIFRRGSAYALPAARLVDEMELHKAAQGCVDRDQDADPDPDRLKFCQYYRSKLGALPLNRDGEKSAAAPVKGVSMQGVGDARWRAGAVQGQCSACAGSRAELEVQRNAMGHSAAAKMIAGNNAPTDMQLATFDTRAVLAARAAGHGANVHGPRDAQKAIEMIIAGLDGIN